MSFVAIVTCAGNLFLDLLIRSYRVADLDLEVTEILSKAFQLVL